MGPNAQEVVINVIALLNERPEKQSDTTARIDPPRPAEPIP